MDSLEQIIEKFINWIPKGVSKEEYYTGEEFLEILEEMKKQEESRRDTADRYGVTSDCRLHRYTITTILDPLIGKMKYGKRITN